MIIVRINTSLPFLLADNDLDIPILLLKGVRALLGLVIIFEEDSVILVGLVVGMRFRVSLLVLVMVLLLLAQFKGYFHVNHNLWNSMSKYILLAVTI